MTRKYNVKNVFCKNIFVLPISANKIEKTSGPADFETAISATGFGKYNLLLILVAIPSGWSPVFETTTMSYVFPAAQCDLTLSLEDKGHLNAITYAGMISSAMIWGFLFDTLGRKKLLTIGFFLNAVFVIMSCFSQTKTLLMVSKFFGGFIINGPASALTSYISEFHCAKYRARMQLVLGTIFCFGSIILPMLAWSILPQNLYFSVFNNSLEFHSWNIYLLLSGIAPIISAIIFLFMPESPKFLMTVGQNDKALRVFQKVYSVNTGNGIHTYPIKELVDEIELKKHNPSNHGGQVTANRSKIQALKEGWQQMKPLFFPPYFKNIVLLCLIQTLIMMSLNTLRLWLPQIFQAINDFQYFNNGTTSDLCEMLKMIKPSIATDECIVNLNNSSVYINSIIVASVSMFSYFLAGYLINILGKKKLLNLVTVISGSFAIAIYFATDNITAVAFSSIFIATGSIASNVMVTVIIDLFPTTLRTTTISLAMMLGRIGAMIGNLVFPFLLQTGCAPPFFSVGLVILGCAFLALLLPNTDLKALE
jgi:VNT family MFS transporter (synaptic vesicle glycoprotein 2)